MKSLVILLAQYQMVIFGLVLIFATVIGLVGKIAEKIFYKDKDYLSQMRGEALRYLISFGILLSMLIWTLIMLLHIKVHMWRNREKSLFFYII